MMVIANDISRMLAERIDQLVRDLLPNGRREGGEWRCGSVAGEPGGSLGVHLVGTKAGVWSDFATGIGGDALALVAAVLGVDIAGALDWSRRWLGIEPGEAAAPRRPPSPKPAEPEREWDRDRWRRPWQAARPIAGTLAELYLTSRGLRFRDPGRVFRFAPNRGRRGVDGELERHPALLVALCDVSDGVGCGIINIFLRSDGSDRLRDAKGKTVTGRAREAVVMLSPFDEPTDALVICEGTETGIAILSTGLKPIWACGGAGTLATFPVLAGIEALTIAADADEPGQKAAATCAERWRAAGREVAIVAPPAGDWADPKVAA